MGRKKACCSVLPIQLKQPLGEAHYSLAYVLLKEGGMDIVPLEKQYYDSFMKEKKGM